MSWFTRRGDRQLPDDEQVIRLAETELARRGVAVTREDAGDGRPPLLRGPDGDQWFVENLLGYARLSPRREWRDIVSGQVDGWLAMRDVGPVGDLTVRQLHARLRSRLLAVAPGDRLDYARPFAPGVVEVLCLDYPRMVATVTDDDVADLALPLDQAYRVARRRTDAEPVERPRRVGGDIWELNGESLFVASHAARFGTLVPRVVGPAPLGALVGIPNRGQLLYVVLTEADWLTQTQAITSLVDRVVHSPDYFHPGGTISADTYYWAPDGRIDPIGGRRLDPDDTAALTISPPPSFLEYVTSAA